GGRRAGPAGRFSTCGSRVQGASRTAYVGESVAGNVPVIGIEGLLALAGTIVRLQAAWAGGGEGGGPRCQLMQRCPPVNGLAGRGSAGGGVSGGGPGPGAGSAGGAGRADDDVAGPGGRGGAG